MTTKTFALAAALFAVPAAGLAHSSLEPGTPRDGETLRAAPEVVRLVFSDPMRITVLKLTGPDGDVPLMRTDGMKPVTTLEATPSGAMGAGAYEIEWRGMGDDGHVMEGGVDFRIEP